MNTSNPIHQWSLESLLGLDIFGGIEQYFGSE